MPQRQTKKMRAQLKGLRKMVSTNDAILPVQERPDALSSDRIDAHDLFSMFTANIIQKKTTFTR
jgi:hypothetical protein